MRAAAQALGFAVEVRDTKLVGEVTGVAEMVVNAVRQAPSKSVLLWGGETTVEIKGKGEGGRNLQLAATALIL